MHAIAHRLDHFGESFGTMLRLLLTRLEAWLIDAGQRLGTPDPAGDGEILWIDGEPEERR
jgi:hypothetical protein